MRNLWFWSDQHLSHKNILTFTDNQGNLIRPGFGSIEEHDELLLENHNKVVKPGDHVYYLGDTFWSRDVNEIQKLINRLPGKKRLILGNHDDVVNQHLYKFFHKILLWRVFEEGIVATHLPLSRENFPGKCTRNVHGHIHQNPDPSPNHLNVSMERINYTPIHYDEIVDIFNKRNI